LIVLKKGIQMEQKLTYEQLVQGCENEKLHLSGRIQSFGALVRIDRNSGNITHASANLEEFTGVSADIAMRGNISALGWNLQDTISRLPDRVGASALFLRALDTPKGMMDLFYHSDDGGVLVEIEKTLEKDPQISTQQAQMELLSIPTTQKELAKYHQCLVDAVHEVTGYGRVMIYRFREDWSGEVVAEYSQKGLGSYLGLRFPASDIPAIARNLYMINPSRLISDTMSGTVDILSHGTSVLDLTYSDLRSVSPVHLEYLANMGVHASFSVPIKISGALWGLLACHHTAPQYIPMKHRNTCVTFAQSFAIGLSAFVATQRLKDLESIEAKIETILEALALYENPLSGMKDHHRLLLELVGASGMAIAIRKDVETIGDTPDLDFITKLDDYFENTHKQMSLISDNLASMLPEAKEVAGVASGVLAIKAKSFKLGDIRFYWFRPEQLMEVVWAGNPDKPVDEDANATALSPRRSFEKWEEIKHGYSRPWDTTEKITAQKFRNMLLRWL
jgi:two-component system, chemotaxis family, sensor kinase Cph1